MPIDPDTLAHWNEVAPLHAASPFYRRDDFLKGENVLDPVALTAIGKVEGLKVLHLQCHFGLDTLSLARMGAKVVGLDFSPAAIKIARELALETGIAAEFVEADVLEPPPGLEGFDLVFASWGAIFWIDDLEAWMRVAHRALRPGGRLVLLEGHPAMAMLDDQSPPGAPLTVRLPYASREPLIEEGEVSYAGASVKARRTRGYLHGLARILGAAIDAGLRIDAFEEGDCVPWAALKCLEPRAGAYWSLPAGYPFVPLSFTLKASRPA